MGAGCIGRPIPHEGRIRVLQRELNSYINRFHRYHLSKLEEKFNEMCKLNSRHPDIMNFKALKAFYAELFTEVSIKTQSQIFDFFNEEEDDCITFRDFVSRLSIILFAPSNVLNRIIFSFYDHGYTKRWKRQQLNLFCSENAGFLRQQIGMPPNCDEIPVEQFVHLLHDDNFDYQGWKRRFDILEVTEDEESLCSLITEGLEHVMRKGDKVFVLSCRWFEKWKLYIEHNRRLKQNTRKSGNETEPRILAERPVKIDNQELQGQFQGQLRPNIIHNHHYMLLAEKNWEKLFKIYRGGPVFERFAFDEDMVELYPINAHFLNADKKGRIEKQEVKHIWMQMHTPFNNFILVGQPLTHSYFYKNLGSLNWKPLVQLNKSIVELGLQSQCFIVKVQKDLEEQFTKRNSKQEMTRKNFDFGDKVYALSLIDGEFKPAYIIGYKESMPIVHYLGYWYSYDRAVKLADIQIEKQHAMTNGVPPKGKKKRHFRGMKNVGNTCFINSIFQDLLAIAPLTHYVSNRKQLKMLQGKRKKTLNLASCFATIVQNESVAIDSQSIVNIINTSMPEFSGYQQHDAQQFLSMFLNNLSEELRLEQKYNQQTNVRRNIVSQLFEGATQSEITCENCHNSKKVIQNFYTLSVPLPQSSYDYFKLLIFPCSFEKKENLVRIGFKLIKNSTVQSYLAEFSKIIQRSHQDFFLIELYLSGMSRIINLKSNLSKTLNELFIRPDTNIIAYEKAKTTYKLRDISEQFTGAVKQGDVIDYLKEVKDDKEIWSFGKIEEIVEYKNEGKTQIKIKDGKDVQVIEYEDQIIAPFLTKSKFMASANLKVMHRMYNAATSKIQVFGLPFIASIPYWATFQQAQQIISRQMHMFVKQDKEQVVMSHYRTQNQLTKLNKRRVSVSSSRQNRSSIMVTEELKATNNTQEIIANQEIQDDAADLLVPVDQVNSEKTIDKSKISFKLTIMNDREKECPNCSLSVDQFLNPSVTAPCKCVIDEQQPLSWQYELRKCVLAIDWKNLLDFNPNYAVYQKHDSFRLIQKLEENDVHTLDDCLDIFSAEETVDNRCENCKHQTCKLQTMIQLEPAVLIVHLKRFKYQDKYLVKLQKHIKFDFNINLQDYIAGHHEASYELFAVTCHLGTGTQGHYISYVQKEHPIDKTPVWVMFDDDDVSIIQDSKILKLKAYLLFFRKKNLPASTYVNYLLKPSS